MDVAEEIIVEKRDQVAIVSLNRPSRRNAVSLAMWRRLGAIFAELDQDPAVRAVILTGTGGCFSAGADISEFPAVRADAAQSEAYETALDACCDAIAACGRPTIAVIDGFCIGGAVHLAISCDFRFVSSSASVGVPASRISIVYGVRATARLLALVGLAQAKRILFSGDRFSGETAARIGFADDVSDDAMTSALGFARGLAAHAPLSISGAKYLLNGLAMGTGALDLEEVRAVIGRAAESEDYQEGQRAFLDKRSPIFRGC